MNVVLILNKRYLLKLLKNIRRQITATTERSERLKRNSHEKQARTHLRPRVAPAVPPEPASLFPGSNKTNSAGGLGMSGVVTTASRVKTQGGSRRKREGGGPRSQLRRGMKSWGGGGRTTAAQMRAPRDAAWKGRERAGNDDDECGPPPPRASDPSWSPEASSSSR